MYRICLYAFLLLLSPAFQGCGLFDSLKSDSPDAARSDPDKGGFQKGADRLKAENIDLKQQLAYMKRVSKKSVEESRLELAKVEKERAALASTVEKLKDANHRIALENRELKQQLQSCSKERKQPVKQRAVKDKQTKISKNQARSLKIKVLSGDGHLESAREMATKLMKMGYEIRAIGYAPRSDFSKNIIYFKPQFKNEGEAIVSKIDRAIMRTLTWSSVFDIIIVTGRNP